MKIVTKIRWGSLLLALVPSLTVGVLVGWTAIDQSTDSLKNEAQARLVSLREGRATQIESYLSQVREHLLITAGTISTQRALAKFSDYFRKFDAQKESSAEQDKASLLQFYRDSVSPEYARLNGGKALDVEGIVERLDGPAITLQNHLIATNPNPLGSKHAQVELGELANDNGYARWHKFFHPSFRKLQQGAGYHDVYLVNGETGHVVYSVLKEIDYASSLNNGPLADSGLAEAFNKAMAIDTQDQVVMTDFAPYLAAHETPSAFMGTPVFNKGKKVGAIIFKLPGDRIQSVMTGQQRWQESGLGQSGETYLVGADGRMRSESRRLIEDREAFLELIAPSATPQSIEQIRNQNTVVGTLEVKSPAVTQALAGETGFTVFRDYRGVDVLSAYRPLQVSGVQWVMLAEMDASEAFAAAATLRSTVIYQVAGMTLLVTLLAVAVAYFLGNGITRPLHRIIASMNDISSGDGDLTVRLDQSGRDELAELAAAFNQFVGKIDSLVGEVRLSMARLASASEDLTGVTEKSRDGASRQQQEIEQIAIAVEQMSGTVDEVVHSTSQTAEAARQTGDEVETGRQVLQRSLTAIRDLSDRIQESQGIVDALSNDSERVGSVLEVISSVAEQTNLLALNAAIEAARAGEQGRGFAVVADEVRVLAQRTQESTGEIRQIIESLQSRSRETIRILEHNNAELRESVSLSEATHTSFEKIEDAVNTLLEMSAQIARATEQQSATTAEISNNVQSIHNVASDTAEGANETAASSNELAELGAKLSGMVNQFKVSRH